ncbi:MAG: helical backbone metal receptor, partial [Anaerolineales bacterium]|nr:helical backbone metal receptor [Anaerolineales bacterium]
TFSKACYFCPVWHERIEGNDYWMVFDHRTYAADLLSILRAESCFRYKEATMDQEAEHLLKEGLSKGDKRYYKVTIDEVRAANPELILLPSEPYPFNHSDVDYLKHVLKGGAAIEKNHVHLIDGKLIFWYGTRLGQALQELPSYFLNLP